MNFKKLLLSGIGLAVLFGSVLPADAQYRQHRHRHRHCVYRHHHRVCRYY